jgi:hypothetical protein
MKVFVLPLSRLQGLQKTNPNQRGAANRRARTGHPATAIETAAIRTAERQKGPDRDDPALPEIWRARRDSNARPLPSEGSTLSS